MSPKDLVFIAAAMVATIISVISDCEGILRSSCVDLHDKKILLVYSSYHRPLTLKRGRL